MVPKVSPNSSLKPGPTTPAGLGGFELRPRGLHRLLRPLELGAGIDVPRQQKSLALELALGFRELCLGRRHARLCGTQRIELVLRIEPRHDLVRFEPIADIGRALDHAPADAKSQTRFVLSFYSPGKCDRFPALALNDGHRADRTHFRRGGFGLRSAGRQHHCRKEYKRRTRTNRMSEAR